MRIWCRAVAFVVFFTPIQSDAQSDTALIKVTILDSYTLRPLGGVSLINPKPSVTMATDGRGYVEETIGRRDTLFLFYPGYRTTKFSVVDSIVRSEYALRFVMEPLSIGLNQAVIIKAPKTLEQIEEERKKLGITPKELERPEISFTSPISALYEMLSARAQERKKLKQQIAEDDRRRVFKELLNYYNENGLIDLPEENYEEFINYCNLPLDFLKYHSDYEITKTIIDLYYKYGKLSGVVK
ncbi:MAG: hypothetical protein IPP77_11410 [Bacteroidetes bacterium]|nr:hypothetical protein [Bacteroidota bacterium]